MIYINLSKNLEDIMPQEFCKFPKFLKKYICRIRRNLGVLYIKNYDDKVLITISSTNKRTLKRLEKYMKIKCVKRVCLSNTLLKDEKFLEFIKGQDVSIQDGKWLFDYILPYIIDYVVDNKKEKLETQEISILTKEINEVLVCNIKQLATKAKLVNIITTRESKFKKIENELYEENGIMLNINNNYKKSLLKSDIILNIDFLQEEFNEYNLPKKACIINKIKNININSKAFEGILINEYEISLPRKYLRYLIYFKDFDNILLYESFIYKRTNCQNINKELFEDKFHIISVNGKNGRIRKSEIKNLSKNKNIS